MSKESLIKQLRDKMGVSVINDMTPEEINQTFQKLHDSNEKLKREIEHLTEEHNITLKQNHDMKSVIMQMIDRWWPFVHGSAMPSKTAKDLLKKASDVIQTRKE